MCLRYPNPVGTGFVQMFSVFFLLKSMHEGSKVMVFTPQKSKIDTKNCYSFERDLPLPRPIILGPSSR